jgi:hypothetical protein
MGSDSPANPNVLRSGVKPALRDEWSNLAASAPATVTPAEGLAVATSTRGLFQCSRRLKSSSEGAPTFVPATWAASASSSVTRSAATEPRKSSVTCRLCPDTGRPPTERTTSCVASAKAERSESSGQSAKKTRGVTTRAPEPSPDPPRALTNQSQAPSAAPAPPSGAVRAHDLPRRTASQNSPGRPHPVATPAQTRQSPPASPAYRHPAPLSH